MRSLLYLVARVMGDLAAIRSGRVGHRITRRLAGRAFGAWMRRLP